MIDKVLDDHRKELENAIAQVGRCRIAKHDADIQMKRVCIALRDADDRYAKAIVAFKRALCQAINIEWMEKTG